MTRTFIALELNDSLQRFLGKIMRQMAQELPNIRWVDPFTIHLTLAFLGDLNDERLATAMQATEVAAQQVTPFVWSLSHLGIFDSVLYPRVIWIGINESSGRLQQLHRVLNHQLERQSFVVEKRPFSPHLTLARIKLPLKPEERQSLQHLLAETKITVSAPVQRVSQVLVMKSELLRSGAQHTCLHECTFAKEEAQ